jgi:hypothetical protein
MWGNKVTMCYGNLRDKMKFIQRYKSPKFIGIGDKVRYQNNIYDVLVNYIVGETDRHGYTPTVNRTILIDNNDRKVVVNDYKLLEIIS